MIEYIILKIVGKFMRKHNYRASKKKDRKKIVKNEYQKEGQKEILQQPNKQLIHLFFLYFIRT